ncbi:MAG: glutamine--fructose-6-phosphate transaminase (isomerizing) [Ignavibacteriales bacterium]|nr:glutamine--fructose-6-phosphate transaminase (isomerizing) [Ignavibacteriales bacterium]
MCGIVGYIGPKNTLPILLEGLSRMEYRGYDSAGVALINNGTLLVRKRAGKVADLDKKIQGEDQLPECHIGMGHTRWATHGEPNDVNAHPHTDCKNEIAVIHNGIIENYLAIKTKLQREGHQFSSATDTEAVAHLIEELYKQTGDLFEAVQLALQEVTGTYGLVVLSTREPDKIIAARMGSPLIIGVGEGENIVAADAAAIIQHTRQVVYLEDGEVAEITRKGFRTSTIQGDKVKDKRVYEITFELSQIERSGYDHFMMKEINEQPETIRNAMRGRLLAEQGNVKLGGLEHVKDKIFNAKRIIIIGCGTSWHAGLVGEYMFEHIAKIPTEVEYASEFRYRNPIITKDDVVFLISQSGETADTLAALREAKAKGATVLGIVNVVGSTIPRETHGGVYIHAGPEIGVASTKAFTSQVTVLAQIAVMIARAKGMSEVDAKVLTKELDSLPQKVAKVLQDSHFVKELAQELKDVRNFLYLGRGANFPVALEGALKLKEISYIHAEGYPAAEMKHGPIALIDEKMPVVCIVPKDAIYEKVISNVQEVRARRGRIIAVANEDDTEIAKMAEFVIRVPRTYGFFGPIINVIPLQLLSYYIAVARGTNVDQPRNLAKSVTVE